MIAIKINETKNFMGKLLTGTTFDAFLMEECTITTFNTFQIDGHIKQDFYPEEERTSENISRWSDMKQLCFQMIKGKNTPLNFKFVFHLSPENTEKLLMQTGVSFSVSDINALVLSVRFDGAAITCTTGTSLSLFTMDKALDNAWDTMIRKFFSASEISFEEL